VAMSRWFFGFCFSVLSVLIPNGVFAQVFDATMEVKYDTSYITAYKDELTTRFFLSRKQNYYNLSDRLLRPWINYRTNDNLLVGIGYTYSFLTLNLAVKMPFINADDDLYGKSKYYDLQCHTILGSFIVDLYLQWNKGYYIANPEDLFPGYAGGPIKPVRGDLRTNIVGLNLQYLFNSSRFSYKASFLQNEFQKKSAGSPIVGIEAYWMLGMSDSAMVGSDVPASGFVRDQPFNQADIVNAGINGGYAYTLVWKERIHLSMSTVIGVSGGGNRIHYTADADTYREGLTFGFNNTARFFLGYNNSNYYVGVSYIRFSMTNRVDGEANGWAIPRGASVST
jgi:hypothetical protein